MWFDCSWKGSCPATLSRDVEEVLATRPLCPRSLKKIDPDPGLFKPKLSSLADLAPSGVKTTVSGPMKVWSSVGFLPRIPEEEEMKFDSLPCQSTRRFEVFIALNKPNNGGEAFPCIEVPPEAPAPFQQKRSALEVVLPQNVRDLVSSLMRSGMRALRLA